MAAPEVGGPVREVWAWVRSPRGASWVFAVLLVISIPVAVSMGGFRWFVLDDWTFLNYRELDSIDSLFTSHGGHWVLVPTVTYRVLYALFGIDSYLPYELVAIVSHLGVVVAVRALLRRCSVGPWLSTGVASLLILFGPGSENIVTAFQITFTMSLGFALAQYLLADHDGRARWRDGLALVAGLLAVSSSGVAIPVVAALGVALLVRHGWRRAALQTVPVGLAFITWFLVIGRDGSPNVPNPGVRAVGAWVQRSAYETFTGFGENRLLAVGFAIVLIVGLGWRAGSLLRASRPPTSASVSEVLRAVPSALAPVVLPLALVAAALAFGLLTARSRWIFGVQGAAVSRYRYVYFALLLPALGVAMQVLLERWRRLGPVFGAAIVLVLALNARPEPFPPGPFPENLYRAQQGAMTSMVLMPEAADVPPRVKPFPILMGPSSPTIGFLNSAVAAGKLEPSADPLTVAQRNEFRLRLGLELQDVDRAGLVPPQGCDTEVGPQPAVYPVGARFWSDGQVNVSLVGADGVTQPPVVAFGVEAANGIPRQGARFTVVLPDLRLRMVPAVDGTVMRCES